MANTSGRLMGDITIRIKNENGRDVFINRSSGVGKQEFFVCGYGSGRGIIGTSEFRKYRALDSVATLFDYSKRLVNIELMLRRLKDYRGASIYNSALIGIKRLLGLSPDYNIFYAKGGGVKISGPGIGEDIPLEGLADGYRMTFNWLIDIYGWAIAANAVTDSGGVRGILLIDEIDQNLHPKMQRMLLNELRNVLPEMQVFATTHSPITALGTESENIISLHRKGDRVIVAAVPSLAGYSADDILVEESLFGTDSYPQYTREKLDRHFELASIPDEKRTKRQSDEMIKIASEIDPRKLPHFREDPIIKKLDKIEELLLKEQKS